MDHNILFATLGRKPIAFAHDENKWCGHPHKSSQFFMKAIQCVLPLATECINQTLLESTNISFLRGLWFNSHMKTFPTSTKLEIWASD
jgi:hypothetical protein